MAKHSKKYLEAAEKVDRNNLYTPDQAIALLKSMPARNFDESVEAVLRLNVDPRKADQLVRGTVSLPHGTGKTVKVLVFARGPQATAAQEAGADIVGDDELIAKVQGGFLDFDSVVATPDMMGKVGRLGRVLGPRRRRRGQASQAVHREGPLHHQGDHHLHDGPRHPGRPERGCVTSFVTIA